MAESQAGGAGVLDSAAARAAAETEAAAAETETEMDPGAAALLKVTAIEADLAQREQRDDFQRLNPDATEAEAEDFVKAVTEGNLAEIDRIQKDIQKRVTEREAEQQESEKKVTSLNTGDSANSNDKTMPLRSRAQRTAQAVKSALGG